MKLPDSAFINRELSWLEFNQRVLDEASDSSVPLLERLKFLAITSANLDEFFMVRVGGLRTLVRQGANIKDRAGLSVSKQLDAVLKRVAVMAHDQEKLFAAKLEPELAKHDIVRLNATDRNNTLNDKVNAHIESYLQQLFEEEIASVVTPMAVTSGSEFPYLHNLKLNIIVRFKPDSDKRLPPYAVIVVGQVLGRLIKIPSSRGYHYILIEDLIRRYVSKLFVGREVVECAAFRITRNADIAIAEDEAADLLSSMQGVIDARKESDCVRLEIEDCASAQMRLFLRRALRLRAEELFVVQGPLALSDYMALASRSGFDKLRYTPWPPQIDPALGPKRKIVEIIRQADILLCHPYESFDPVVRFVSEAADDPAVLAIKQILYRTSRNSPIVAALARAAQNGKHVTALVELKARFDEERNIDWASKPQRQGVQVIYGVQGLKTHAKLCIVVRREPQGIVRYVHFGTGNYNEITARVYSDISLMSSNTELGLDASAFFNAISGNSQSPTYLKLAAAPLNLRETLLILISSEAQRAKQGGRGLIIAKMNSLVDAELISALCKASSSGVQILLNVRGICCLRPGLRGISENITVVSIVDRFLEHSRIFYFFHGGEEKLFISSADWMPRNLDRRVELMVPVEDEKCKKKLKSILDSYFKDTVKAHVLCSNGLYKRKTSTQGKRPFRSQEAIYRQICRDFANKNKRRRTVFEPYKSNTKCE